MILDACGAVDEQPRYISSAWYETVRLTPLPPAGMLSVAVVSDGRLLHRRVAFCILSEIVVLFGLFHSGQRTFAGRHEQWMVAQSPGVELPRRCAILMVHSWRRLSLLAVQDVSTEPSQYPSRMFSRFSRFCKCSLLLFLSFLAKC
jgi:hypothetical protein